MAPALSTGVIGCRIILIINVFLPFAVEVGKIALLPLRKAFHTYIYIQDLRGVSFVISEKA